MQGPFLRKYGVETIIDFVLYETDGASLKTDAAHAVGDTKIMKNEGAEANTTNGFVDEGQGYSITLTATEMQAARIVVYVVDQTSPEVWIDDAIIIDTYGNASGQHAFDLDTATQDTNVASMDANSVASGVIASAELNNIADALLKRDWTSVAGEATRSALNALRFLRNKWSIAAGTLTVTEEDDATTAWQATLTTDAAADPVTASDPT